MTAALTSVTPCCHSHDEEKTMREKQNKTKQNQKRITAKCEESKSGRMRGKQMQLKANLIYYFAMHYAVGDKK